MYSTFRHSRICDSPWAFPLSVSSSTSPWFWHNFECDWVLHCYYWEVDEEFSIKVVFSTKYQFLEYLFFFWAPDAHGWSCFSFGEQTFRKLGTKLWWCSSERKSQCFPRRFTMRPGLLFAIPALCPLKLLRNALYFLWEKWRLKESWTIIATLAVSADPI